MSQVSSVFRCLQIKSFARSRILDGRFGVLLNFQSCALVCKSYTTESTDGVHITRDAQAQFSVSEPSCREGSVKRESRLLLDVDSIHRLKLPRHLSLLVNFLRKATPNVTDNEREGLVLALLDRISHLGSDSELPLNLLQSLRQLSAVLLIQGKGRNNLIRYMEHLAMGNLAHFGEVCFWTKQALEQGESKSLLCQLELAELASKGKLTACWKLYREQKSRGVPLTATSIRILLEACRERRGSLFTVSDESASVLLPLTQKTIQSPKLHFYSILWADFKELTNCPASSQVAFYALFMGPIIRTLEVLGAEDETALLNELSLLHAKFGSCSRRLSIEPRCVLPEVNPATSLSVLFEILGAAGRYELLQEYLSIWLSNGDEVVSTHTPDVESSVSLGVNGGTTTSQLFSAARNAVLKVSPIKAALWHAAAADAKFKEGRRSEAVMRTVLLSRLHDESVWILLRYYFSAMFSLKLFPLYTGMLNKFGLECAIEERLNFVNRTHLVEIFKLAFAQGRLVDLYEILFASYRLGKPLTTSGGNLHSCLMSLISLGDPGTVTHMERAASLSKFDAKLFHAKVVCEVLDSYLDDDQAQKYLDTYRSYGVLPDGQLISRFLFCNAETAVCYLSRVTNLVERYILFANEGASGKHGQLEISIKEWKANGAQTTSRLHLLSIVFRRVNQVLLDRCLQRNGDSLVVCESVVDATRSLVDCAQTLLRWNRKACRSLSESLYFQFQAFFLLTGRRQLCHTIPHQALSRQREFWVKTDLLINFSPAYIASLAKVTNSHNPLSSSNEPIGAPLVCITEENVTADNDAHSFIGFGKGPSIEAEALSKVAVSTSPTSAGKLTIIVRHRHLEHLERVKTAFLRMKLLLCSEEVAGAARQFKYLSATTTITFTTANSVKSVKEFPAFVYYLIHTGMIHRKVFVEILRYLFSRPEPTQLQADERTTNVSNANDAEYEPSPRNRANDLAHLVEQTRPFSIDAWFWVSVQDIFTYNPGFFYLDAVEVRSKVASDVYGVYEREVLNPRLSSPSKSLEEVANTLGLPLVESLPGKRSFTMDSSTASLANLSDLDSCHVLDEFLQGLTHFRDTNESHAGVIAFENYISKYWRVPSILSMECAARLYALEGELNMAVNAIDYITRATQVDEHGKSPLAKKIHLEELVRSIVGFYFLGVGAKKFGVDNAHILWEKLPASLIFAPQTASMAAGFVAAERLDVALYVAELAAKVSPELGGRFYLVGLRSFFEAAEESPRLLLTARRLVHVDRVQRLSSLVVEHGSKLPQNLIGLVLKFFNAYFKDLTKRWTPIKQGSISLPKRLRERVVLEGNPVGKAPMSPELGAAEEAVIKIVKLLQDQFSPIPQSAHPQLFNGIVKFYVTSMRAPAKAANFLYEERKVITQNSALISVYELFIMLNYKANFKLCVDILDLYLGARSFLKGKKAKHERVLRYMYSITLAYVARGYFWEAINDPSTNYLGRASALFEQYRGVKGIGKTRFDGYLMGLAAYYGDEQLLQELYSYSSAASTIDSSGRVNYPYGHHALEKVMEGFAKAKSPCEVTTATKWFDTLTDLGCTVTAASLNGLLRVYGRAGMENEMWNVVNETFPKYGVAANPATVLQICLYYVESGKLAVLNEKVLPYVRQSGLRVTETALCLLVGSTLDFKLVAPWVSLFAEQSGNALQPSLGEMAVLLHAYRRLGNSVQQRRWLVALQQTYFPLCDKESPLLLVYIACLLRDYAGAIEWVEFFASALDSNDTVAAFNLVIATAIEQRRWENGVSHELTSPPIPTKQFFLKEMENLRLKASKQTLTLFEELERAPVDELFQSLSTFQIISKIQGWAKAVGPQSALALKQRDTAIQFISKRGGVFERQWTQESKKAVVSAISKAVSKQVKLRQHILVPNSAQQWESFEELKRELTIWMNAVYAVYRCYLRDSDAVDQPTLLELLNGFAKLGNIDVVDALSERVVDESRVWAARLEALCRSSEFERVLEYFDSVVCPSLLAIPMQKRYETDHGACLALVLDACGFAKDLNKLNFYMNLFKREPLLQAQLNENHFISYMEAMITNNRSEEVVDYVISDRLWNDICLHVVRPEHIHSSFSAKLLAHVLVLCHEANCKEIDRLQNFLTLQCGAKKLAETKFYCRRYRSDEFVEELFNDLKDEGALST